MEHSFMVYSTIFILSRQVLKKCAKVDISKQKDIHNHTVLAEL